MRGWMFVLLALWASGCTNDYGDFRYPKAATTSPDAGAPPAADAGNDTAPTD